MLSLEQYFSLDAKGFDIESTNKAFTIRLFIILVFASILSF